MLQNGYKELPLPRDFSMLPENSQALLRAARMGVHKRVEVIEEDKENEDNEATETNGDSGFVASKWALVPRDLEGPEPEYLAKRRKGLPSVYSGITAPTAGGASMRKTRIKKIDSEGNRSILEVLIPEGQSVDGEIVEEETSPAQPLAPGTVVEGIGIVNAEGLVVAGEQVAPAPVRRRPPIPKKKKKHGPGRGRKKTAQSAQGQDGSIRSNRDVQNIRADPQGESPGGKEANNGEQMDGEDSIMQDPHQDDEDGSEEGSEGEEGEELDREEGEVSPSPSLSQPAKSDRPAEVNDNNTPPESTIVKSSNSDRSSSITEAPSGLPAAEFPDNDLQINGTEPEISVSGASALEMEVDDMPPSPAPEAHADTNLNASAPIATDQFNPEVMSNALPSGEEASPIRELSPIKEASPVKGSVKEASPVKESPSIKELSPVSDVKANTQIAPEEDFLPQSLHEPPTQPQEAVIMQSLPHDASTMPMDPPEMSNLAGAAQPSPSNVPSLSMEPPTLSDPAAVERPSQSDVPQMSVDPPDLSNSNDQVAPDAPDSSLLPYLQSEKPIEPAILPPPLHNSDIISPPPIPQTLAKFPEPPLHLPQRPSTPPPQRRHPPPPTLPSDHPRRPSGSTPEAPTPSPPTPIETTFDPPQQGLSPKAPTMSPPTPIARDLDSSPETALADHQQRLPSPPPFSLSTNEPPRPSIPGLQSLAIEERVDVQATPRVEHPNYNAEIPNAHNPLDGLAAPEISPDNRKLDQQLDQQIENPIPTTRACFPRGGGSNVEVAPGTDDPAVDAEISHEHDPLNNLKAPMIPPAERMIDDEELQEPVRFEDGEEDLLGTLERDLGPPRMHK